MHLLYLPRLGRLLVIVLSVALGAATLQAGPAGAAPGRIEVTVDFGQPAEVSPSGDAIVYRWDTDRWVVVATQYASAEPSEPVSFGITVPPGTYRVCVEPSYYITSVAAQCVHDAIVPGAGEDVVVDDAGTTTVSMTLTAAATIKGRVVDESEAAVGYFRVDVFAHDPAAQEWRFVAAAYPEEGGGSYMIGGLHGGSYRLCAVPDGRPDLESACWENAPVVGDAADVQVAPGQSRDDVDFVLAERATISGTVAVPQGVSSPVYVGVYRRDEATSRWIGAAGASPDAAGRYRVTGLAPDVYRLCASGEEVVTTCWENASEVEDASGIAVDRGADLVGYDLDLARGGTLTGTVSDVYLAAQGYLAIDLFQWRDGAWQLRDQQSIEDAPVVEYAWRNLRTGTYRVCVSHMDPEFVPGFAPECYGGTPAVESSDDISVTAGETTSGVDIDVDQPGTIRGRVTADGAGIATTVELYQGRRLVLSGTTTADGRYGFIDLPAGEYRVGFHRAAAETPYAAEYYQNSTDGRGIEKAKTVVLPGDAATAVTNVHAVLDPGGTIHGRLLSPAGEAVAGCRVRADGADGSLAIREAVSAADGSFDVAGLSTASYRLRVVGGSCSPFPTDRFVASGTVDRLAEVAAGADAIRVVRGETTTLPWELGVPHGLAVVAAPRLLGVPKVGERLEATGAAWMPAATTTTYRWRVGGVAVPGATGPSYVVRPEDVGLPIRVEATGARAGYLTGVSVSEPTAPATRGQLPAVRTRVVGRPRVGKTVRVRLPDWGGLPVSVKIQWLVNGQVVRGAKRARFTPERAYVGRRLKVRLTVTAPGYDPLVLTSGAKRVRR